MKGVERGWVRIFCSPASELLWCRLQLLPRLRCMDHPVKQENMKFQATFTVLNWNHSVQKKAATKRCFFEKNLWYHHLNSHNSVDWTGTKACNSQNHQNSRTELNMQSIECHTYICITCNFVHCLKFTQLKRQGFPFLPHTNKSS